MLNSCRRRNHLRSENKGDKQLWDCPAADQHLCFHMIKSMFSYDAAHIDWQVSLIKSWMSSSLF